METVEDILDGPKPEAAEVTPLVLPTLPDAPKLPAPGIYFGMPEDEYHALPALSSHGVQKLLASPMLYWASATWLSYVARKAEDRKRHNKSTVETRRDGKAYHCRILEGAEEFERRFARELSPEDCEGALTTTEQIKAALGAFNLKPWAKVPDTLPDGTPFERSAKKEDWIRQLLARDPDAKILDVLMEEHSRTHDGKTLLPADTWDQIEIAAAMIEKDPEVRRAFVGGYPEVTLIWNCRATGVPMKARVDYLQLRAAVDLKSIGLRDRSIEQAIRGAIATYKYAIQPSVYVEGVQAVKALVRETNGACIRSGDGKAAPNDQREFATKWAAEKDEPKWLWVFQGKFEAPVTRACFYPLAGSTRMVVDEMVKAAKRKFRLFAETIGTDPWVDTAPIYDLMDEDFYPSTTEI